MLPVLGERYNKSKSSIVRSVQRVFAAAGFENPKEEGKRRVTKYGFHSFRHSFVSFLINAGVPVAVVQEIVGHGNPIMTQHYTHISQKQRHKILNALPGQYSKATTPEDKLHEIRKLLENKKKLSKLDKDLKP